jgi:cytochrome b pre-mRNA-processing protein 3
MQTRTARPRKFREQASKPRRLGEVPARLNPLDRLRQWRSGASNSEKLYGAIVAQARLPIFYRSLGVPDTLEGRFTLLSLHLFAILHRLKAEGSEAAGIVQGLVDRFSQDMETVLRELGVSDIRIPKKMRGLAASSLSLLQAYENALARGQSALAETIEAALPDGTANAELSSRALASYLWASVIGLEQQTYASLQEGAIEFPEVSQTR